MAPLIGGSVPFITYFPAVLFTAFFAGFRPALAATMLSGLSGLSAWWLVLDRNGLSFAGSAALVLLFLAITGVTVLLVALVNAGAELMLARSRRALAAERREAGQHLLVIRELEHRTRNILGLVRMLATHSLKEVPAAARQVFLARLDALSTAYELDTDADRVTLRDVLDRLLRLQAGRIDVEGCDLVLGPRSLQQLTLIVHELHTNAMKYGALSVDTGRVAISGVVTADAAAPTFTFTWQESGGPAVGPPARQGFGQVILRQAPEVGGARVVIDYAPCGLRYVYQQALAKVVA
ncbi:MAG: HWE histidine kinase domain-containing protein [Reyranellaceae bacterium]